MLMGNGAEGGGGAAKQQGSSFPSLFRGHLHPSCMGTTCPSALRSMGQERLLIPPMGAQGLQQPG